MYLRNTLGFRVCSVDFGIRKFFDEGFAQLYGYRAANALEQKCAHANACANAATASGLSTLQDRIQDWENTVFQMRYYPLYQTALSFVAFLENQIGSNTLIEVFREANCDVNFHDVVETKIGVSFPKLLDDWTADLSNRNLTANTDFFKIVMTERIAPHLLQVEYCSEFPLYPTKDILVYNSSPKQLPLTSHQRFRYQKTGLFTIECPVNTPLNFIIVFDNKLQNIYIEKCL